MVSVAAAAQLYHLLATFNQIKFMPTRSESLPKTTKQIPNEARKVPSSNFTFPRPLQLWTIDIADSLETELALISLYPDIKFFLLPVLPPLRYVKISCPLMCRPLCR